MGEEIGVTNGVAAGAAGRSSRKRSAVASSSTEASVANHQNAADPPLLVTVGDNAYQNGTQSDWDGNAFIPEYENQIPRRW